MPQRPNRDPNGEWKAIVLSYDYIFSLSEKKCSYCLTEQQAMALIQIAEYLAWQTRWVDASEGKDNDKLAAFSAGIQDVLMSGCCGDDGLEFPTRYDEDGLREISYDGGITWVPDPNPDPRFNGTILPPLVPIEGEDMKCIGAENVVLWFRQATSETVDSMNVSGSVSSIIAAILGIVVLWIGVTVSFGLALQPLLLGLASALAFTTGAAFAAAMTEDVYERLRCNIYCHISDDGSVSPEAWQAIKQQIGEEESGIAFKFLYDNVNALGPVGLTNASRSGNAAAADCEDCECEEECAAQWEALIISGTPYASDVSYASDYIQFTMNLDYAYIGTGDPDKFCFIGSVELVSGSAVLTAHSPPGQVYPSLSPTSPVGGCATTIEFQGDVGSVWRIHMGPCP